MPHYSRTALWSVCIACLVLLSGCGFRLAGTADLPESLVSLNLVDAGFSREQRQILVTRLQKAGASLGTPGNESNPTLSVSLSGPTETALFETGNREQTKRLSMQLSYRIRSASGGMLQDNRTLTQESDLEIDLFNIVASEREKEEVAEQMLEQLISRMIYQLQRM